MTDELDNFIENEALFIQTEKSEISNSQSDTLVFSYL